LCICAEENLDTAVFEIPLNTCNKKENAKTAIRFMLALDGLLSTKT